MKILANGKRNYSEEMLRYPAGRGNVRLNGVRYNDTEPYDPVFRPPNSGEVLFLPGLGVPGTKIFDRSGNGNHGTITGATWVRLPSGLWVNSLTTNQEIDCGTSTSLQFTTQDFAIEGWIFTTDMYDAQTIVSKGSFNADGYFIQVQPGGNLFLATAQAGTTQSNTSQGSQITTYKWFHIAVVRSGVNAYFYINGVLKQGDLQNIINPVACTASFKIGVRTESHQWWIGNMVPPRISNRALSAPEIANIYARERHLFGV